MSARQYRILVASMWLPIAPTGGALRRFELTKRLARDCNVTLFGGALPGDLFYIRALKDAGVDVREAVWDDGKFSKTQQRRGWRAKLMTVKHSFSSKPGQQYWQDVSMAGGPVELRQLASQGEFDVIHVEASLAHWFHNMKLPAPLVVDFMDINSILLRRQAYVQQKARHRLLMLVESYKMMRYERSAATLADVCTTTSPTDSSILRSFSANARTYEVPNGVDSTYFRPSRTELTDVTSAILLFTGTMGYQPNIDAMQYFATNVFPHVRTAFPDVCLQIVGASPSPEVRSLESIPGVQVVGPVPDIRPYFEQATVVVAPLRIGSGTRIKILEALAMGKAVVTTPVGAEGLNLGPDEIVTADLPTSFTNAVIELLSDSLKRKQLGKSGLKRVIAQYDWSVSAAGLFRLYSALAERRPLGDAQELSLHV